MGQIYNFSAGPAVMPASVLAELAAELPQYADSGQSVMEMSHRSKFFEEILGQTEADLRELLGISEDYQVLFLSGGASLQFAMIPMNFMHRGRAAYLLTGHWAKRAYEEAKLYGQVDVAASSEEDGFSYVPDCSALRLEEGTDYVYMTENNTIYGTKFWAKPEVGDVPLINDVSSSFLSEPMKVADYAMLYGGVQKNLGPAGLVICIIRRDLIGEEVWPGTPTMMRYATHAKAGSLYNTPPTYNIYAVGKVLQWIKGLGGLEAMRGLNEAKAAVLYEAIDASDFYRGYARPDSRSLMNVTFTTPNADLDAQFVAEAAQAGIINVKGHRKLGGLRASLYNAMPIEGVKYLVEFMCDFEARRG